ncbi:hypothetical protein FACS189491_06170 [Spirochaetia bacterium]|nr:hypothetical protein FACS189491_06170 [Spirochaetia bacterium]
MNGSGKGGNNRRKSFKHRDRDPERSAEAFPREGGFSPKRGLGRGSPQDRGQNTQNNSRRGSRKTDDLQRYEKPLKIWLDRPKWVPPQLSTEPIPSPDCPYCGKPINDMSMAIADKGSGTPVHFDCVIARLAEGEILEPGDAVTYIGGGRFGVVQFPNPSDSRNFKIKKIVEWEKTENRADWRKDISDHYSVV